MLTTLTELDRMKLLLLNERSRRIEAEFQALRGRVAALEQEQQVVQGEQMSLGAYLKGAYELGEGDRINMDGSISRAKKAPELVPSPVEAPAAAPEGNPS